MLLERTRDNDAMDNVDQNDIPKPALDLHVEFALLVPFWAIAIISTKLLYLRPCAKASIGRTHSMKMILSIKHPECERLKCDLIKPHDHYPTMS